MADLSSLELFVKVVDLGSYTAAADAFGVSKSHVSRQVSALEDRLGARLLNRTTRAITLTEAGRMFHERCTEILGQIEDAERAVTSLQTKPRGELRISAPMTFGIRYLAPVIAEFMAHNPELTVDAQLNDRRIDVVEDGFDLAVRIGKLPDSSLIARRIAEVRLFAYASPAYIESHPEISKPEDLRAHECLLYLHGGRGPQTWTFTRGEAQTSVAVTGPMISNNGEVLLEAARTGLGITFGPDFIAAPAVEAGEMVPVLPQWYAPGALWVVYPHRRHVSAKVRAFVDFMAAAFVDPPWAVCWETS